MRARPGGDKPWQTEHKGEKIYPCEAEGAGCLAAQEREREPEESAERDRIAEDDARETQPCKCASAADNPSKEARKTGINPRVFPLSSEMISAR